MAKARFKKRKSPVVRIGEIATPERRRQNGGLITEVADRDASGNVYTKRQRAKYECILDCYHDEYRLNDAQYTAGLKFQEIFHRCFCGHAAKELCAPFLIDGGEGSAEHRVIAHIYCTRLLDEALEQMTKKQQAVVRSVCGFGVPAGHSNKLAILGTALTKLARYWKLNNTSK